MWADLPTRTRRVSALRVGRTGDGLVRLWVIGRVWILPASLVGRPRRNGEARVVRERLLGEWRAYEAMAAALGPRRRRR